ncbi:restriction endonuclease PLD domain-containing protein [Veillonella sp. AS16]|uniref:restriction endonuclease PLD domain-containing protein n=1 Tax=Veillonella sp. AS16 TaxID=936589 RepID=UPI0003E27E01|nr:restriction endonuclease PLD domain-containing protein [Veillonella sp. AS16]ETS92684.1 NgoFVII restriction endonuclease [Veillonella sp. AS16]
MLYYKNLEQIIFSKHELLSDEPDELLIISGYLGPAPIERLRELPNMKITIIGGMYSNGIDARLLNSLNLIKSQNDKLNILYSRQEIHSKIYIWKKDDKILSALIGSANFSSNGLRTDFRESLADATRDTFSPLKEYAKFILNEVTETPPLKSTQAIIEFDTNFNISHITDFKQKRLFTVDIPLYSETQANGKFIPKKSGLNWCFANAHVSAGDAYIRIPKSIIKLGTELIKPYDTSYVSTSTRRRNSDSIEIIWDDGVVMEASLEGEQKYDNKIYPKQIASYKAQRPYLDGIRISTKSILGRYLRKRLNVSLDDLITLETLENYGRTTITLSLIEEGTYYADFSV